MEKNQSNNQETELDLNHLMMVRREKLAKFNKFVEE